MANGFDWKRLLEMATPVVGGLVAHGAPAQTGFQSGFLQGQQMAEQEKNRRMLSEQTANKAGADYVLRIGEHAQGITDPLEFDQFLKLAENAGTKAGYIKPGELTSQLQFPASRAAAAKLTELSNELDALDKSGYDLDQLAQGGSSIQMKDGSHVPVQTALELTRKRPTDASGQPIARPKKQDVNASTDYGRFLSKYAKDKGKSVDDLTTAEELDAKKQYGLAGDKPSTVAASGADAQYNDLVELYKAGHNGQDPPAAERTRLRKQANEVNDRPQTLGGMNAFYEMTDPNAIADGIRNGTSPPDISQYGRAVQGAVASILNKPTKDGRPRFDLSSAQRTWKAQLNLNRTMNGAQQVRLDESIRSGLAMYDKVDEIAGRWDSRGWGPLSRANLALAREGMKGPAAQAVANELTGQIGQLTSDIATIEQGGLTPTSEARAVAEKSLQDWWGKGTILTMTAQGRANMKIRELARATQEPMAPGNVSPPAAVTPPPATTGAAPLSYQDYLRAKGGR